LQRTITEAQTAGGANAQTIQHFCRQDLAHTALEGQTAISSTGVRGGARAFGAKVVEFAIETPHLAIEEAAPVSDIGVIFSKLVAVVAHGQEGKAPLKFPKGLNKVSLIDLCWG
jgi:hypothetical protein